MLYGTCGPRFDGRMTISAEIARTALEQVRDLRAVRFMTGGAATFGDGIMRIRLRAPRGGLLVAARAQIGFLVFEQTGMTRSMRIVARAALAVGERTMHIRQREDRRQLVVTSETSLFLIHGRQRRGGRLAKGQRGNNERARYEQDDDEAFHRAPPGTAATWQTEQSPDSKGACRRFMKSPLDFEPCGS